MDSLPCVSRGRLWRVSFLLLATLVALFGITALMQNRTWPADGHTDRIELVTQVVRGQATVAQDGQLKINPLPGDGVVAIALLTQHAFDAVDFPVIEIGLPQASAQYQYRLVWKRTGSENPDFFILSQPVGGISLSDLSIDENWHGRIEQLGLVIEPLFPLGLSPGTGEPVIVEYAGFPETGFWLKWRSQWHEWFSWQPPRFGALNHLPAHRGLPWYATPAAVAGMAVLFVWLLLRRTCPGAWLMLLVIGSAVLLLVEYPQWRQFHHWATGHRDKSNPVVLSGDRDILPIAKMVQGQPRPRNAPVVILSNQYDGLRLYWHLLPENTMWVPALSLDQLSGLPAGTLVLIPQSSSEAFSRFLKDLQSLERQPLVNRAGQWWLIRWQYSQSYALPEETP